MRIKWLILLVSVLTVMGFSGLASADWFEDECGDATFQPNKDLKGAKVEIFPDLTYPNYSPWMYACINMCAAPVASGLPGLIVWEFDVDHNASTGGASGMTGMGMKPCSLLPAGHCKKCPGFDIVIMKALREQGTPNAIIPLRDPALSQCAGCYGTGGKQCAERGDECEPECYESGVQCYGGDGCYLVGSQCATENCYPLEGDCPGGSCIKGALAGEWQASLSSGAAGGIKIDWGRDQVAPTVCNPAFNSECEKFPWGEILRKGHAELLRRSGLDPSNPDYVNPKHVFNLAFALANPPKWQVSTYFDQSTKLSPPPPLVPDGDDYMSYPAWALPGYMDITDWLPNGDNIKADAQTSKGGDCWKVDKRYNVCMDTMADQYTTDYDLCRTNATEGDCLADECYWNSTGLPGGACVSKTCNADSNFDGAVDSKDLGVYKKDLFRIDCPK